MVSLTASARSSDVKAKVLRRSGQVPCVLYGNDTENIPLQCAYNNLHKAFVNAGKSTLVELDAGSGKVPVLFHAVEFDPVSDKIIHVDFYAVDMKKEIEAEVPIRFEGEAPAVKELGGIFFTTHDHVTVKCLPTALPHDIPVSLEKLVEFGASLTVGDLVIPEGVSVHESPETVIAMVQEPRKEEVIEEVPAEGEEEAAEGEGEGEGEGEEKAEGEGGGEETKEGEGTEKDKEG